MRRLIPLLFLAFATLASADPNATRAELTTSAGMGAVMNDEKSGATPVATIAGNLPVTLGSGFVPVRAFGRLELSGMPGTDLALEQGPDVVKVVKAARATLGLSRIIGQTDYEGPDGAKQSIAFSVRGMWGWDSALPKEGEDPKPRLSRRYGIGIGIEDRVSRAAIEVYYGRDELCGDRGWGQWMARADIPVPLSQGILRVVAEASLSVGPSREDLIQHDIWRVSAGVDVGKILSKL